MRATCPIFSTSLPLSIPVRNMYGIKIIEIVHRKDKRPMTIRISSPKIWLGRKGIKKTESKRKIAAARNGVAIIRDVNPTIKAFFETELVIYCTCPSSQEGSFLVKYPVTYSLYLLFPLNLKPTVLQDKLHPLGATNAFLCIWHANGAERSRVPPARRDVSFIERISGGPSPNSVFSLSIPPNTFIPH